MALEYRLVLAGDTPIDQVAERAFPDVSERPTGAPPRLTADHLERYGFIVTVLPGRDGYFDLETDNGSWVWEPKSHVRVHFRLDKFADLRWAVANMLGVVRRALDAGPEDAIFDFNGEILLFARLDGKFTKHRRGTWWEHYPSGDQLIPG
ncbi:SitI3 family protein [Actinoplanes sp. NPDC049668]|uniref:SitI3 family protein n=1 Tax=unclassified Actinoplanes TaxID=2626549 RepID=UPI0033BF40A9